MVIVGASFTLVTVTATAWREMAAMNAFDLGFDVLPKFVGRMRGYIHDGYHRDIGTIDALNAASREVELLAGRGGKLKGTKQ